MTNALFISAILLILIVLLIRINRVAIIKWLMVKKSKLALRSLRGAIHEADKRKQGNGRKQIVIYNSTTREYEPIEKKKLKIKAHQSRRQKGRVITTQRIKEIEKKSLYVTN